MSIDWKKAKIYALEDDEYIYAIAITSKHPLFLKVLHLCQGYQRLLRKKYSIRKIYQGEDK